MSAAPVTPKDVDAALADAQQAVDELARATGVAEQAPAAATGPVEPPLRTERPAMAIPESLRRILHLKVPVIVRLAERRMPVSDIVQLTPGAILEFETPVDSDLRLLVSNKCVGTGEAVKVGENFGMRVHQIGDVRDRIASLGG